MESTKKNIFFYWIVLLLLLCVSSAQNCKSNFTASDWVKEWDGAAEYGIKLSHPALDPEHGYVSGLVYQVSVEGNNNGVPFKRFILRAMLDGSDTFIGNFTSYPKVVRPLLECSNNSNVVVLTNSDFSEKYNMTALWSAPEILNGCINFLASVINIKDVVHHIQKKFCERKGCFQRYTEASGSISSPGFPAKYPNSLNCVFIIQVPLMYKVKLQFQTFDLESAYEGLCYDYVIVTSNESFLQKSERLCGNYKGSSYRNLSFVSDGNNMVLKFVSDDKIGGTGFNAIYYAFQPSGCNTSVTGMSGDISSVNYPAPYFPLYSCTYYITVPNGYYVALTFNDFDLEITAQGNCVDYIAIETADSKHDAILCGEINTLAPSMLHYETRSEWMILRFFSDYLTQGRGFQARFNAVQLCFNETYNTENGTLQSVNYPEPYLDGQECYITIEIPNKSKVVELQFVKFHTEARLPTFMQDEDCDRDYVAVNDGLSWHRRCGNWTQREELLRFKATSSRMVIKFFSNSANTAAGFKATWRSVPANVSSISCQKTWTSYQDSCIKVLTSPMTWQEAQEDCKSHFAHLIHITDETKEMFLQTLIFQSPYHENSSAYWLGANDSLYEGEFFWTDMSRVNYTNWFPGWPGNGHITNRQPNDDGLSQQDCVETRQMFWNPSKGGRLTGSLWWNDRQCTAKNYYICEQLKRELAPTIDHQTPTCDSTIYLSQIQPEVTTVSPGYPRDYDAFLHCDVIAAAPPGYVIQVTFLAFNLEESESCQYDYLQLESSSTEVDYSQLPVHDGALYCGNWTSRLKLLRYVTKGNLLNMRFITDYSTQLSGYHAILTLHSAQEFCKEGWAAVLGSCYKILHQDLSQSEAVAACADTGSHVLQLQNEEDLRIANEVLATTERNKNFWIGVKQKSATENWTWMDGTPVNISYVGEMIVRPVTRRSSGEDRKCLVMFLDQFMIKLAPVECNLQASIVCVQPLAAPYPEQVVNITGTSGNISSPGYPNIYKNDVTITWYITTPPDSVVLFVFNYLDIEYQEQCLYDSLFIGSYANGIKTDHQVFCNNTLNFHSFAVQNNKAMVKFKTDYIIQRRGFFLNWTAVDMSLCDNNITINETNATGVINSLNYPQGYVNNMACSTSITTPPGYRIYLVFTYFRLSALPKNCDDHVILLLDSHSLNRQLLCSYNSSDINKLQFLSLDNYTEVIFTSDEFYNDIGFSAEYWLVKDNPGILEEKRHLEINGSGHLVSLNWPLKYPPGYDQKTSLRAPTGHVIQLNVLFMDIDNHTSLINDFTQCRDYLQIVDEHARIENLTTAIHGVHSTFCGRQEEMQSSIMTSYVNEVVIYFRSRGDLNSTARGQGYILEYTVIPDPLFVNKTRYDLNIELDSCEKDTCHSNATCERSGKDGFMCNCSGPFRGLLCAYTFCDSSPCKNGAMCTDLEQDYNCACPVNYNGKDCQLDIRFCALTNCRGHGDCYFRPNWTLACRCGSGWKGEHCEKPMTTYINGSNPGSRLLNEPFWIGIIVVLGVLFITGLVVIIRRKFLHKINCQRCLQRVKRSDKNSDKQMPYTVSSHVNGHDASRYDLTYTNNAFSPASSPMPASTPVGQPSPSWDHNNMPVIKVHFENEPSRPSSDMDEEAGHTVTHDIEIHHCDTPTDPPPSPSDGQIQNGYISEENDNDVFLQLPQNDPQTSNTTVRRSSSFSGHLYSQERTDDTTAKTFSTSLDMGLLHPNESELAEVKHFTKSHHRSTLSVNSHDKVFFDGEETEHYRVNSAQRRREFVNSVMRARYQSLVDNDQPHSNHSSGSQCRSCGSYCSLQSVDSDIRQTSAEHNPGFGSSGSTKDSFSMSMDLGDGHSSSHRCSVCSDDGYGLHRTSSRTSDISTSSKRHRHHHRHHHRSGHRHHHRHHHKDDRHHHHHHHHRRDSRYYSFDFDPHDDYHSKGSHHSSKSDILVSRSTGSVYGNHLQLTRTMSRDWSSEANIERHPSIHHHHHKQHRDVRRHRKVEAVRSDGSASSLHVHSRHRSKPVMQKSKSVDIRDAEHLRSSHRQRSFREPSQSRNFSDERPRSKSRTYTTSESVDLLQIPNNENNICDNSDSTVGSSETSLHIDNGLHSASRASDVSIDVFPLEEAIHQVPNIKYPNHENSKNDYDVSDGYDIPERRKSGCHIELTMCTPSGHFAKVDVEGENDVDDHMHTQDDYSEVDIEEVTLHVPPKSSPEDDIKGAFFEEEIDPKNHASDNVVDVKQADLPSPSKHPLRDSAYQSKEQSTEKSNSTAVSPTSTNNRHKEDVFTLNMPMSARMEDKRVTKQLELAARKLVALQELEERSLSADEATNLDNDLPIANGCLLMCDVAAHPKSKVRLAMPSRMLSMIADEEYESSAENNHERSRGRSIMTSQKKLQDVNCNSIEGGIPLQDLTVKSAANMNIAEMLELFDQNQATEV